LYSITAEWRTCPHGFFYRNLIHGAGMEYELYQIPSLDFLWSSHKQSSNGKPKNYPLAIKLPIYMGFIYKYKQ